MLSAYKYKLLYSPARLHSHCDALRRLPLADMPKTVPLPAEMLHLMDFMESGPGSQTQVREWTHRDPVPSSVLTFVRDNWTRDLSDYPSDFTPYKNRESESSVQNGCKF